MCELVTQAVRARLGALQRQCPHMPDEAVCTLAGKPSIVLSGKKFRQVKCKDAQQAEQLRRAIEHLCAEKSLQLPGAITQIRLQRTPAQVVVETTNGTVRL